MRPWLKRLRGRMLVRSYAKSAYKCYRRESFIVMDLHHGKAVQAGNEYGLTPAQTDKIVYKHFEQPLSDAEREYHA